MSPSEIRAELLDTVPGLSEIARAVSAGEVVPPTASPRLDGFDEEPAAAGPAWSDAAFVDELRAEHTRLGASPESRRNLDALSGEGAACVVTGQQPGLLLGPLFCFYKLAGAVAIARELSARHGRRVVPVYWCGADDSDFEEVRRAWAHHPDTGPFRAEIPATAWQPGQRVGDVIDASLPEIEAAALRRAGVPETVEAWLASMQDLHALADRARAWTLRMFSDDGLVVVDARSSRLRALGRPLFERYASEHARVTAALEQHTRALREQDWPVPIDERARSSGLFRLDGDRRRKVEPEEMGSVDVDHVTPSVLLRPVWQDALLGPAAAVLGPAELAYHGQLSPLYDVLGVRAARPAARPHAVLVPSDVPWPDDADARAAVLRGDESVLRRSRLPAAWGDAVGEAGAQARAAMEALETSVGDDRARREVRRVTARVEQEIDRLRDRLASVQADGDPGRRAAWFDLRGRPQERAYAAPQWWAAWQDDAAVARTELERAHVRALQTGRPPCVALHLDPRREESDG